MRGSSINFQKALKGAPAHNDRTEDEEVNYLLPLEYRLNNEFDLSAVEVDKKIKRLLSTTAENYKKIHGQKLQAKSS